MAVKNQEKQTDNCKKMSNDEISGDIGEQKPELQAHQILKNRDLFSITVLQMIDTTVSQTQALILTPTNEHEQQLLKVVIMLSEFIPNIRIQGEDAHIVIGTPKQVDDMIENKNLNIQNLKFLIIDNYDKIIIEGLKNYINKIILRISQNDQKLISQSAMSTKDMKFSNNFQPNQEPLPLEKVIPDGLRQFYVEVEDVMEKGEVMLKLLQTLPDEQTVIFCNTKRKVDLISKLLKNKFNVVAIHGGMDEKDRIYLIKEFQEQRSNVLITTDIISQEIRIPQVRFVLNYDLPVEEELYIHRIGRAVQFGKKGIVVNLVNELDFYKLQGIIQQYEGQFDELPEDFDKLLE
ncbi:MAG: putative ATP-dependent RNA helicase FAL1 [Streblomastix strix]|uniref:RNA helicase n=1 Tax=Streblomastix strix TaxID=222440 RepID=A0A5J4VW07_9EUKA|nr:MAG: putative ATP-dependent RNA helicase FAL1 [Streblomastix strix]